MEHFIKHKPLISEECERQWQCQGEGMVQSSWAYYYMGVHLLPPSSIIFCLRKPNLNQRFSGLIKIYSVCGCGSAGIRFFGSFSHVSWNKARSIRQCYSIWKRSYSIIMMVIGSNWKVRNTTYIYIALVIFKAIHNLLLIHNY